MSRQARMSEWEIEAVAKGQFSTERLEIYWRDHERMLETGRALYHEMTRAGSPSNPCIEDVRTYYTYVRMSISPLHR